MAYRYRTTLRPAAFGGLPAGVGYRYVELPPEPWAYAGQAGNLPISRHRYGVIETDRELTPQDLDHFDIVPVPDEC